MSALSTLKAVLEWWVDRVCARAPLVLLLTMLTTLACGYYVTRNIGINTDTSRMLDPNLPYQVANREIDRAFPAANENLVVVVDGDNPDRVEDATRALAAALERETDTFEWVSYPQGDQFLKKNGLLYLSIEELSTLSDRLAQAQPLIGTLWRDPSLRGFADILGLALEEAAKGKDGAAFEIAPVLTRIAEIARAQADGRGKRLAWSTLIAGENSDLVRIKHYILARAKLDDASLSPAGSAMAEVRRLARLLDITQDAGLRVRMTGSAALDDEELRSVREGMGLVGALSLGLVVVLLAIGLKSLRLVGATVFTLVVGLTWTAAFATVAVGQLNLISVAFAVLFIGLSVDFGIHYALRYREAHRTETNGEALCTAAGGVGPAMTLAAVCAVIGFFSFLPTDYRGLAELGLIAGVGMFVALFANLTVLPAVLSYIPASGKGMRTDQGTAWHAGFMLTARRHAKPIALGALVLGVTGAFLMPRARFDFDPIHLKDPDSESVRTLLDIGADSRTGPYSIKVLAGDLAQAREIAARLKLLETVDSVETVESLVPASQEEKLVIISDTALYMLSSFADQPLRPPSEREIDAAAEGLLDKLRETAPAIADEETRTAAFGLEAALRRLQPRHGVWPELQARLLGTLKPRLDQLRQSLGASAVTIDDLPDRLRARYLAADGRALVQVYPSQDISRQPALQRFVKEVRARAPNAAGAPVVILEAANTVIRSVVTAGLIAVISIMVLLVWLFRRLEDVFLVFAPLALAAVLTVSATVLLGVAFNFANVIVLPLLFGLGVASGIHLVMRERGESKPAAMLETSTPRAVVFSALTTIGSFASLAISNHVGTASMGILLTVAITLTMACTLIVLPVLVAVTRNRSPEKQGSSKVGLTLAGYRVRQGQQEPGPSGPNLEATMTTSEEHTAPPVELLIDARNRSLGDFDVSTRILGLSVIDRLARAARAAGFTRVSIWVDKGTDETFDGAFDGEETARLTTEAPANTGGTALAVVPANLLGETNWLGELRKQAPQERTVRRARAAIHLFGADTSLEAEHAGTPIMFDVPPMTLTNSADIAVAERRLLGGLVKTTDGFMSRHVERRMSLAISCRLASTRITPNQMTLVSVAVGVVAGPFFLSAAAIWQTAGALLLLTHSILDGCDGELARLKFQQSRYGGILDFWGDNIVHGVIFACMAIGWSRAAEALWPLALGAAALLGTFGSAGFVYWHAMRRKSSDGPLFTSVSNAPESRFTRLLDSLARRDFIYLVLALALIGKADWFVALTALGAPVFLVLLIIAAVREPAQPGPPSWVQANI